MFEIITIIGFAVTLAGIVLHRLISPSGPRKVKKTQSGKGKSSLLAVLRKLVYLLALLSFVVLVFTGFYPLLVLGEHITGYFVMLHATFSPVFAVCLAVLALMWADKCRIDYNEYPVMRRIVRLLTGAKAADEETPCKNSGPGQKITFWLIILLALPLILSIVVILLGYSGTHQQEWFLAAHRYIALLFCLVAIIHTYLMTRMQAM